MNPIQLGINTYGYIWSTPLADCLRRLHGLGYTDFEAVINPPHLDLDTTDRAARQRLGRELRSEGIVLRSVNLPSLDTNLASPLQRMREYSVRAFRAAIELAADLGAPLLIVVPGRVNPLLAPAMAQRQVWMRESIEKLIPHAQAHGVGLALENVPFAAFPDAASLMGFVCEMASHTLSVCYDVANAHFVGESPAAGLRLVRHRLSMVHCSDTTRSVWRHAEVGLGDLPFAEVHAALQDVGYQGPCMLEIIGPAPEGAIVRSHRALARLGFAPCPTQTPA